MRGWKGKGEDHRKFEVPLKGSSSSAAMRKDRDLASTTTERHKRRIPRDPTIPLVDFRRRGIDFVKDTLRQVQDPVVLGNVEAGLSVTNAGKMMTGSCWRWAWSLHSSSGAANEPPPGAL
jgi:hypothetical protein